MPSIIDIVRRKFIDIIIDFNLIENGDKIILAISWWKDSICMLDLFNWMKDNYKKRQFDFMCVYVVPWIPNFPDYTDFLKKIFISYWNKYIIHYMKIPENSKLNEWLKSKKNCRWCAYTRRISLLKIASEYWYNKIAFWHTFDDCVDTIFMNIINHKKFKWIYPFHYIEKWNKSFIRPLLYIKEEEIKLYNKKRNLENINYICPIWINSFRQEVRNYLYDIQYKIPWFYENIFYSFINTIK